MADYKKMYLQLVDGVVNSIEALQQTLRNAEEIYIETADTPPATITGSARQEEHAE